MAENRSSPTVSGDEDSPSTRLPSSTSSRSPARQRTTRRRRAAVVLAAAGFAAVGTAAAATGGFSAGDTIPAGGPSSPPGGQAETVLATGSTVIAGPWRLTAYVSEQSAAQPAGLPCIRLLLEAPPPETPVAGNGFCGKPNDSGISTASVPVVTKSGETELIVAGVAPGKAVSVSLTGDGRERVRSRTTMAEAEFVDGDVWIMTIPDQVHDGYIEWITSTGERGQKRYDASDLFAFRDSVQQAMFGQAGAAGENSDR